MREAFETPRVSALQHGGAAVLLYAYSETDIVWLRFWTLGGILLSSFLPHAINGNPLFGAWASLFVGINAYRLWGLASERAPVVLDDDEFACYEGSGLARFVHPRCFRRLAAEGRFATLAPNTVLKEENEASPEFLILREGSVILESHGRTVEVLNEEGSLVGIPDLVGARRSSSTKVRATVGAGGCRALVWTHAAFAAAIARERDPSTESRLAKFATEALLAKLHRRDATHARARYDALLGAALRGGAVQPSEKAALNAFRAANGIDEGAHAASLGDHGWTPADFELGARVGVESTTRALQRLVARVGLPVVATRAPGDDDAPRPPRPRPPPRAFARESPAPVPAPVLVEAAEPARAAAEPARAAAEPSPSPVLESITGLGGPGISSNPSTLLKSNSFSMILEPLILASRVLDD